MSNLGDLLRVTGKVEEAETLLRSASSGLVRLAGPSDLATLRATGNLAVLLHSIGRLDEAEPLYRGVIDALRGLGKTRHPDFLSILNNYAMLLQEHDDPDEAEATFREVLAARRQVQGSDHPDTLMSANNLADLLGKIGKVTEAEALWAEVLGRLEQTADRGARSSAGAFAHANLGELLAGRGEREKAREHYRASLEILKATFDADHPMPRESQARLGGWLPPLLTNRSERPDGMQIDGGLVAPGPGPLPGRRQDPARVASQDRFTRAFRLHHADGPPPASQPAEIEMAADGTVIPGGEGTRDEWPVVGFGGQVPLVAKDAGW